MNSTVQKSTITTTTTTTATNSFPHPSTFFPELQICKTIRDLKQVHAKLIKTGRMRRDPLAAAQVLRFCALSDPPHRDLHYARLVFARANNPNCFSWNTLIRALSESENLNDPFEALLLFRRLMLQTHTVKPNNFTFPPVLKACGRSGCLQEGKQIHSIIVKQGLDKDEFVLSSLVRMYAICGVMDDAHMLFDKSVSVDDDSNVVLHNVMIDGFVRIGDLVVAREVFDEMPERSVVSWNSMISGYAQNGMFKEAVELFRGMQRNEDVSPNYVTLVSVLPAISRLGALELGKWVHLYADRNRVGIDEVLGSALIDMYSKCGSIYKAVQVFDRLPQKNVITWNSVISGLAMHGRAKDVIDQFSKMKEAGVQPSDVTYIGVLSACSHAGLVNEGRYFFHDMVREAGIEPRIEHYGCVVDLLGRAGLLEEAEELILRRMPIKPDDVILKALLGACKMHGNIDVAKRTATLLMEMAPDDSGSYVALSNMHASSGDWEAVAEVRLIMKEMNIRKDPGCSWIELDGGIHEFVVEDDFHPRAKEIHMMLKEMSSQLSLIGYRPDTTQVLLNMDDQVKERALQYHSEKIAVAFGLISTRPQTPLRIVKNLRICHDCHSWLKLVSKIYKRQITIRDRKRFHYFDNGSCSCMDYW